MSRTRKQIKPAWKHRKFTKGFFEKIIRGQVHQSPIKNKPAPKGDYPEPYGGRQRIWYKRHVQHLYRLEGKEFIRAELQAYSE